MYLSSFLATYFYVGNIPRCGVGTEFWMDGHCGGRLSSLHNQDSCEHRAVSDSRQCFSGRATLETDHSRETRLPHTTICQNPQNLLRTKRTPPLSDPSFTSSPNQSFTMGKVHGSLARAGTSNLARNEILTETDNHLTCFLLHRQGQVSDP